MAGNSLFEVPQQIALALTLASNATGADFDYLMKTAARESNFRPAAVARTSSARGLFQFIENTWLRTLKLEGAKYGLGDLSEKIFKTRSGRYYVPDASYKRKILKLRHDAKISSLMAGAFTLQNAEMVRAQIGRQPTGGELYLAHFLGPSDAVRMINLRKSNPGMRANQAFPRAAKANRPIFYDRRRARSVSEVYWKLVTNYNRSGGKAGMSWSTHIVRVDPATKKRSKHIKRRLAAPRGAVPLPTRKAAPTSVVAATVPVSQLASLSETDATSTKHDLIAELLRGSVTLPSFSNAVSKPVSLAFSER